MRLFDTDLIPLWYWVLKIHLYHTYWATEPYLCEFHWLHYQNSKMYFTPNAISSLSVSTHALNAVTHSYSLATSTCGISNYMWHIKLQYKSLQSETAMTHHPVFSIVVT